MQWESYSPLIEELIKKQSQSTWKITSDEKPSDNQICVIVSDYAIQNYIKNGAYIYTLGMYDKDEKGFYIDIDIADAFYYEEDRVMCWLGLPYVNDKLIETEKKKLINRKMNTIKFFAENIVEK